MILFQVNRRREEWFLLKLTKRVNPSMLNEPEKWIVYPLICQILYTDNPLFLSFVPVVRVEC